MLIISPTTEPLSIENVPATFPVPETIKFPPILVVPDNREAPATWKNSLGLEVPTPTFLVALRKYILVLSLPI